MRTMTRLIAPLAPVALIVFSTMIYQATASSGPSNAQAEAAGVKALVTTNCRPQAPNSRIYDLVGIETHVAGGIIVRHPEQLRRVCDIVNRTLMNVSLRELKMSRTLQDLGKEQADNTKLLQFAADLDMSAEDGTALVRAHGRQVLAAAAAEKKATGATVVSEKENTYVPASTTSSASSSILPRGGLHSSPGNVGLQYAPASSFGL